jgi:hypothetical protein
MRIHSNLLRHIFFLTLLASIPNCGAKDPTVIAGDAVDAALIDLDAQLKQEFGLSSEAPDQHGLELTKVSVDSYNKYAIAKFNFCSQKRVVVKKPLIASSTNSASSLSST